MSRVRCPGRLSAVLGLALGIWIVPTIASAQVKLEYKYPENREFRYKTNTKIAQTLTLNGMAIETEATEEVVSVAKHGKKRPDGTLPIEQKIDSFHTELNLPGGINLSFDSKNPDAKIEIPQLEFLGEVFKLVGDITYTVVLDEKNGVKAIEGTEKMLARADKLSEAARDSIRSRLENDKIKAKFEEDHHNLPDVLTRPGDSWRRSEMLDLGGGQTMTMEKKYEYVGTEKKGGKAYDKISVQTIKAEYKQDPDAKTPLKVVKSELKVESSSGTILFDREAGQLFDAKGKTRVKGSMTFSAGGMELPGELDLRLDSNTQMLPSK